VKPVVYYCLPNFHNNDFSCLISDSPQQKSRPKVEVGRFEEDAAGNLHLVNMSGFPLASAPPGSLIPTLTALPPGLSASIQITPVFLTDQSKRILSTNYCILHRSENFFNGIETASMRCTMYTVHTFISPSCK
jgi:hypothetical protein